MRFCIIRKQNVPSFSLPQVHRAQHHSLTKVLSCHVKPTDPSGTHVLCWSSVKQYIGCVAAGVLQHIGVMRKVGRWATGVGSKAVGNGWEKFLVLSDELTFPLPPPAAKGLSIRYYSFFVSLEADLQNRNVTWK